MGLESRLHPNFRQMPGAAQSCPGGMGCRPRQSACSDAECMRTQWFLLETPQEVAGEHQSEAQVPQVAPGCVQLSSGRIARPTPKTAPSRASSAELSENFPGDGAATGSPALPGLRD